MANPDLELAERHRYGDEKAFDEVYRRFASMVFNLSYRMSGRAEKAEDLTQEIFLRIYRHLGRFSGRSSLKTWVYQVTLNHCRSRLGRKRWPMQSLVEDDADYGVQLVSDDRDPEDLVMAGDAGRRVGEALAGVKTVFREAVVLRDIEGLPYDEIAVILGVRIGTVRSRIARGRDALRKRLEAARREESARREARA